MNPMYGNRYDMPYNHTNRFNDFNNSSGVSLTSSQIYNDNIYPDEYQENDFHSQAEGGYFPPNDPIQMRGMRMGLNMPLPYFKDKPMPGQNFGNERFSNPTTEIGSRDRSTDSPYRGAGYHDNEGRSTDFRDRERERDRSQRRNRDDKRRSDRSDRNRDRERGDRGRDRDRDRDRSREKDRSRERDRYDYDSRSSSPSYHDNDNDRRHNRDDSSRMDRWMTETPSNTILVRGLPSHIDESPITKKVMASGISPKEVRLMRRNAGASRGFAFVEFMNVEDARQWMEINQGETTIIDNVVTLHYSTPRNAPSSNFQAARCDWICKKCGVHNFRRRDVCFKCGLSREESDRVKSGEGFDDVGLNPCNTLIFRGLDALTTEETLLHTISKHTLLPIKNICIMRDKLTSTSRGYAFTEMNSVRDASDLLEVLTASSKPPFEVDGKQILVSFAKNTFTTVMATQNQYSDQSENKYYPSGKLGSQYDYPGYNQQTTSSGVAASSVSVAQAAIQQAHAAQSSHELEVTGSATNANWPSQPPAAPPVATATTSEYPKYPPPDVSTYQYDESSGYYYDPLTNLYYDANTQMGCVYQHSFRPSRCRRNDLYEDIRYDDISSDEKYDAVSTQSSKQSYDSVSSLEDITSEEGGDYDDVSSLEDVSTDEEYFESIPKSQASYYATRYEPVSVDTSFRKNRHSSQAQNKLFHSQPSEEMRQLIPVYGKERRYPNKTRDQESSRTNCSVSPVDISYSQPRRSASPHNVLQTHKSLYSPRNERSQLHGNRRSHSQGRNSNSPFTRTSETSGKTYPPCTAAHADSLELITNIPSLSDIQKRRKELDAKLKALDKNFKFNETTSKNHTCPLTSCGLAAENVKDHFRRTHCPSCLHSGDRRNRRMRGKHLKAILFLARASGCDSLSALKSKVNKSRKISSAVRINSNDRGVMEDLCKQAGWKVPEKFTLRPLNSNACLIHWRVVCVILNWLTPAFRQQFHQLD